MESTNVLMWSSIRALAGAIIGALRVPQLHGSNIHPLPQLEKDPSMKRVLTTLTKKSYAEPRKAPLPMSSYVAWRVHAHLLSLCPLTAFVFVLWWVGAARPGDTMLLQITYLIFQQGATQSNPIEVQITYVEGKSVALRGPYTSFTRIPGDCPIPDLRSRTCLVCPEHRKIVMELMMTVIHMHDPTLEARSVRRGSLQAMALEGASDDDLMSFSGHTNAPMLHRYLGWGACRMSTRKGCQMAALALLPPGLLLHPHVAAQQQLRAEPNDT